MRDYSCSLIEQKKTGPENNKTIIFSFDGVGWLLERSPASPGAMRGPRRASAKGDGGDYQRGEVLGEGRVSTVYLCLNKSSGQLVAMKQYSRRRFAQAAGATTAAEMASTDELYIDCGLRMRARIEEFRGLDNRHLVKYLGGERIDDTYCVYTEYVPGGSIASLLKRFGPLSEMVAHSYATQLFDGIEYLHTRKIVHGNISTRHILVASDGTIKLSGYASSFHRALAKVAKNEAGGEAPSAVAVAAAGSSSLTGRSRSRDRLTGDVRSAAHVIVQMVTSVTTLRWTDALAAQLNEHNAVSFFVCTVAFRANPSHSYLTIMLPLKLFSQRSRGTPRGATRSRPRPSLSASPISPSKRSDFCMRCSARTRRQQALPSTRSSAAAARRGAARHSAARRAAAARGAARRGVATTSAAAGRRRALVRSWTPLRLGVRVRVSSGGIRVASASPRLAP